MGVNTEVRILYGLQNNTNISKMIHGNTYTKDEITQYLASQGLVYSGLEEHFDEWFDRYLDDFVEVGNNMYIYHENGW